MMAARRLKGLGRLALVFLIAIGCYLVSLQVAIERKKLDKVNDAIIAAHRDIRQLETEFKTRSSLRQLERWNGEVLALSAPTADQFVHDERQLASMDFDARPDDLGQSPMALALVSAAVNAPAEAAVTPAVVPAAPARPAVVRAIADAIVPTAQAATRESRPAKPDPVMQRMAEVDKRRAQRVAMLENKLLGDDLVGDLTRQARAESRRP